MRDLRTRSSKGVTPGVAKVVGIVVGIGVMVIILVSQGTVVASAESAVQNCAGLRGTIAEATEGKLGGCG